MKIIEYSIRGKYDDPDQCEDSIFINDNYVVVIDGVTTKSDRRYHGKRSGKVAAEILMNRLGNMREDLDSDSFLQELSDAIHSFSISHHCQKNEIPRACVVAYSRKQQKIIGYGDCQYRMNGKTYSFHKKIDRMNETLRSYVIETALRQGSTLEKIQTEDPGRKAIQPFLNTQYLYENQDGAFGYPVLNGDEINHRMIDETAVPAGTEVILASDGYPVLKDTLKESEEKLADLLADDPLCYRQNPQTKGKNSGQISYDDRSYIRFRTE